MFELSIDLVAVGSTTVTLLTPFVSEPAVLFFKFETCEMFGFTFFIRYILSSNFLSTGLTDELLIVWIAPWTEDCVAFLITISDDSEMSAEAAPFLLALLLEEADDSPVF